MTTSTPRPVRIGVTCGEIHDRADTHRILRPLLVVAGVGFAASWVAGLSVFSSSTQVRSSGTEIQHAYSGHVGVVALQYLLTEGLPAVCLALVTLALGRAIRPTASATRMVTTIAGLTAAGVSLVQLALGLWLSLNLVDHGEASTVGDVYRAINRLDGVKMLLLAVLAVTVIRAIRRHDLDLPNWLSFIAAALAVTITLSAIGYLSLNNTLATAAWLSLPCLIVFITGAALALHRRPLTHPS